MKLVIVTIVTEFRKETIGLFKKAHIEHFSEALIDGHKNNKVNELASNWFASEKANNESIMLFSFTEEEHIETLFTLIKEFNKSLNTNNPIRAIVVPIEKSI